MQEAPAVVPLLVLVGGSGVRVTDRLTHPAPAQCFAGDAECLHRTGQVVQHLEHRGDVVAGTGQCGRVPNRERHRVRHTLGRSHTLGGLDRAGFEIDAVGTVALSHGRPGRAPVGDPPVGDARRRGIERA
jgi:hypothetical protein